MADFVEEVGDELDFRHRDVSYFFIPRCSARPIRLLSGLGGWISLFSLILAQVSPDPAASRQVSPGVLDFVRWRQAGTHPERPSGHVVVNG